MKAIWTGSVGFGLVNIPIKMYSAVDDSPPDLDMLDKKDHSKIKFKRINENTGKEVEWKNIVKGYWINNKYVALGKEDFEKASPEKTNHIEITGFVKEEEIDSGYFEQPYYLEPQKIGTRAYSLLQAALKKTGKAGVAGFVMHNREHLCIIKSSDDVIILNRIRFAGEIRNPDGLKIPTEKPNPAELKMAVNLINQLTQKFDISKYKDQYTSSLLKIIRAKLKGKAAGFKPMKIVHAAPKDLMAQLKESLSETKKRKVS